MSGEMVQILVVLATIAVHFGSGLHMEVWPKVINELVTDMLSVKCVPNDKNVIIIELDKTGQPPLAVLRQNHLTHGADMKDNMKAEGLINDVNITDSHLTITIKKPGASDGGQYECKLFYIDAEGTLKEGKAYAKVTVDNDNDEVVHIHLIQRLADLETTLKTQFGDQQKEIDCLITQLEDQQNEIGGLKTQLGDQQNEIDGFKTQLGDKQIEIDSLKQQRVTHEAQYKLLDNKVTQHVTKESFRSAFLAGGKKSDKYEEHKIVKYPIVKLNIGGHYNPGTGVYTAPVDGLYVFHLLGTDFKKDLYVLIDMRVNGVIASEMLARDEDDWEQSSISVIANLKTGDKVDCYVNGVTGGSIKIDNFPLTAFSGYLIKTM